jgi:hypothetical protein
MSPFNWILVLQILRAILEVLSRIPAGSDHTQVAAATRDLLSSLLDPSPQQE